MTPDVLRYAAFTEEGRGGNPAGVVVDAASLDDAQMLAAAADVGYSETAFVVGGNGSGSHDLRFFSPVAEVAFCGHATIATAVALAERDGPGVLELTTQAGPVTVTTTSTPAGIAATLTSVPTRTRPASEDAVARTLDAFGWHLGDLDPAYPVHVAFAGVEHLVIAAGRLDLLAALDYDYPKLDQLMKGEGWTTVHAFFAESPVQFQVRNAFPPGGVVEDPATGAAAAAFGGYLRTLGLVQPPVQVTILQGHHMGAPSRLLVDLAEGTDQVSVTGHATRIVDS